MGKIYLIENPKRVKVKGKDTIVVVHSKYPAPIVEDGTTVSFSKFKDYYREYLKTASRLILVGLTQMITPSNRTDYLWETIYNNTPNLEKIVIDMLPFRVDPWRIWFIFGAVGEKYLDYTYSYIAETHYKAYIEEQRKLNPFSLETIIKQGRNLIISDYKKYFKSVIIAEVPMSEEVHEEYKQKKEECFDKGTSISSIIKCLSNYVQNKYPKRKIPSKASIFNNRNIRIVKTDLKVDDFLVSELLDRINLTNNILEAFYVGRIQEI